jgi:signal transduction histidine kinase
VRVEIQDQGHGFDPAMVQPNRFGLQGIRQRAELFGGTLNLITAPGQGTWVVVDLPLVAATS